MSEAGLKRKLEMEHLVATIAKMFVMLDDISEAIDSALEVIGKASNASRAYVFEFDAERKTMSNTYEWCNEGVSPEIDNLKELPMSLFPWWIKQLEGGKVLNIRNVNKLGPMAAAEKEILEAQGIKSVLVLPIFYKKDLYGFVGFDNCENIDVWKEQDEVVLGLATELFSHAFERKSADAELKHTNDQLVSALEELQRVQTHLIRHEQMAAIGQLAAGVAHEINNPLGFVKSNHDLLRDYVIDVLKFIKKAKKGESIDCERINYIESDLPDIVADIDDGLIRITKIVEGLRSFSRVDESISFDEFNLMEGLENTLTILRSRLKYSADLILNIQGEIPMIYADGSKLNQVFLNLLTNALDAIEENKNLDKGKIEISACRNGDHVDFRIKDNGIGIPKEVQGKIYQPFFTTKPVGKGTGYGLSIVYDTIVSLHNGSLEVESEYGRGTTFLISLPIYPKKEVIDMS